MTDQPRTETQNRSLHLYFTHLAEALNEAGLDMRKILKPSIDIPWTPSSIKEFLWRPIMKAQLGIESTKDLTTKDIDKIYDTINRHLSEKFGLTVEFPSLETLAINNLACGTPAT
jgi:hypothetical protein